MGWPKEFGGAGASYMTQTVYMEEMSSAGAPGAYDQGVWLAGPAIMMHGTKEQQDRWLRRCAPVAPAGASFLGARRRLGPRRLQTRAVRDGDDYVVNGQKIWTTRRAHARTGASCSRAPTRTRRSTAASATSCST